MARFFAFFAHLSFELNFFFPPEVPFKFSRINDDQTVLYIKCTYFM